MAHSDVVHHDENTQAAIVIVQDVLRARHGYGVFFTYRDRDREVVDQTIEYLMQSEHPVLKVKSVVRQDRLNPVEREFVERALDVMLELGEVSLADKHVVWLQRKLGTL